MPRSKSAAERAAIRCGVCSGAPRVHSILNPDIRKLKCRGVFK